MPEVPDSGNGSGAGAVEVVPALQMRNPQDESTAGIAINPVVFVTGSRGTQSCRC